MTATIKPQERAPELEVERSKADWGLGDIAVGYGLSTDAMRELIAPDGSVFLEGINSMPFGRPKLDDIRDGIDFVQENDYPALGEA